MYNYLKYIKIISYKYKLKLKILNNNKKLNIEPQLKKCNKKHKYEILFYF